MGSIVLATTGTAGDIVQFLEIGRALVSRGHDVTLVTHAPYAGMVRAASMAFEPLDTEDEYARLLDASATLLDHGYDVSYVRAATEWYETDDRIRRQHDAVRAALARPGPAIAVGRFLTASPALAAAEAAGARGMWAVLWPAMLSDLELDPISDETHTGRLVRERALVGLGAVEWRTWIERFPALGLWPDWFGPVRDVLGSLRLTGFVPADSTETGPLPEDLQRFLAAGPPPVLVTAGSGKMVRPTFYDAAIGGCVQAGRRAVVVTRHREHVPAELPAGVIWSPSAPFATLSRHLSATVHHGGIGTCARMLAAGVPQLVLADGVDRPDNGNRIQQLGAGRCLLRPFWSPAGVAATLSELGEHSSTVATQLAERVARDDGAGHACAAIEARLAAAPA